VTVAPEPRVPEVDTLLHEPARLRILALLAMVESADFMYLLRRTGLSRGNLSVQMSRLTDAGIVDLERTIGGRRARTTYSLTRRGLDALRDYRRTLQCLLEPFPE
jgi:DNA-binding transcriptional ArsR family regulator